MDPKDPKVLVKEARQCFDKRDFNTAVIKTRGALKKEPENYTALLIQGASLQELGKGQQSLECYKKAAQVNPSQDRAWQGIIKHYEKMGVKHHPDLVEAYKKVAVYYEKTDQKKYIENYLKMTHVLISQQDPMAALKILKRLQITVGLNLEIATAIVSILGTSRSDSRTTEIDKLYTDALEVIINEAPKPTEDTYRKFFSQLYRSQEYTKLSSYVLGLRNKWNVYYSPMEWVCRLYLEKRLMIPSGKNLVMEIDPIDVVTDKLFKLHPSSTYGYFARGKFLYEDRNKVSDSINWIKTGLESSYNLYAVKLIVNCKLKVGEFQGAYDDCQTAIRKSSESMLIKFKILSVKALIELDVEKAQSALDVIRTDLSKADAEELVKIDILELQAMIHVKNHDFKLLENLLASSEVDERNWRLQLFKLLINQENNTSKIAESIQNYVSEPSNDSNFELILEAAELAYHLKEYDLAAELYLKSQNTSNGHNHPTPWKYLGHIYTMQEDTPYAATCYQKSYDMIPTPEVGALLSDAYSTLGKHAENKDFLIKATKHFRKANSKWVWVRLGLLHLHDGEANEAVVSLQSAIRTDHEDCHIWESLADAYFSRGSYTAALNAYKEAIRLGADPIYPKLKIGVVFQSLGEYKESVDSLLELSSESPNNPPVLVELANGYLHIALKNLKEYLDVSGIQAAENGLLHAVRAIKLSQTPIIQPWLIIGEISIFLGVLPYNSQIRIPNCLAIEATKEMTINLSEEPTVLVPLKTLLESGTRSLFKALNLANASKDASAGLISTLYYMLSRSYYARSKVCIDDKENMLKQSVMCAKKAISLNDNSHVFYNMLGIVSHETGNDKLAQHCFVKSLQTDSNNVTAWTNLGVLYLTHNNFDLAHKAFSKAQSVEPTFAACWTGQALVAEKLIPTDAMDLYRHSSQLTLSPLSVIAYADWVCKTVTKSEKDRPVDYDYSIVHLDAVNVAGDLIRKIAGRHPSACALNAKGMLSALSRLQKESLEAFNDAVEYATEKGPLLSAEETGIIQSNRISALVHSGQYKKAKCCLQQVEKLDRITTTNAALIYDKTGDLNKACELYEAFYNMSETDEDKSNTLVAMALVLNRTMDPQSAHTAKSFLFKSATMARNPYGLLALCSIGLLNNEPMLVEAALQELTAFVYDEKFVADVGLMRACALIMKDQPRPAINALLKLIKLFPTITKLRFHLASLIVMFQRENFIAMIPRNLLIQAERLSKTTNCLETGENDSASASASLIALTYLLENDWSSASISAQKALKQYPSRKDNWAIIVYALWRKYLETKSSVLYTKLIKIAQGVKELSADVQQWVDVFSENIKPL